jgi:hypothetical protein
MIPAVLNYLNRDNSPSLTAVLKTAILFQLDLIPDYMVAEKSIKYSRVFLVYYSNEIDHYLIELHLSVPEKLEIIHLKILENNLHLND